MSFTKTFHQLQKDVPAAHYPLLCHVINYSKLYGYSFEKVSTMALEIGVSPRKIQYSLSWLRTNGYIKTISQKRENSNKQKESKQIPLEKAMAYVEIFEKKTRKKIIYETKEKELFAALHKAQNYLYKAGFSDDEMKAIRKRGREIIRQVCRDLEKKKEPTVVELAAFKASQASHSHSQVSKENETTTTHDRCQSLFG